MPDLYRIIDANLNRSREGIRVIEDIARFYMDNTALFKALKTLRHKISYAVTNISPLIANRNSRYDTGKEFLPSLEGGKKEIKTLILSNFRRAEESLRVLEEVYKIKKSSKAGVFKALRFKTYTLEKKVYEKV